MKNTLMTYY